nr:hypothetical protein Iba_chr04bCG0030 [Ipomoea batatas]
MNNLASSIHSNAVVDSFRYMAREDITTTMNGVAKADTIVGLSRLQIHHLSPDWEKRDRNGGPDPIRAPMEPKTSEHAPATTSRKILFAYLNVAKKSRAHITSREAHSNNIFCDLITPASNVYATWYEDDIVKIIDNRKQPDGDVVAVPSELSSFGDFGDKLSPNPLVKRAKGDFATFPDVSSPCGPTNGCGIFKFLAQEDSLEGPSCAGLGGTESTVPFVTG